MVVWSCGVDRSHCVIDFLVRDEEKYIEGSFMGYGQSFSKWIPWIDEKSYDRLCEDVYAVACATQCQYELNNILGTCLLDGL